jgi:hypothetical protein
MVKQSGSMIGADRKQQPLLIEVLNQTPLCFLLSSVFQKFRFIFP